MLMQYWFSLQRVFTVLIVILSWKLRSLPVVGLNAMFKRRISNKKELWFDLYGSKLGKENKTLFFQKVGSAVVFF